MARQTPGRRKPKKKGGSIVLFARDAVVALAVVAAVLLGMFAYTGLWPPLVVVESNSMMHGTDNRSHIGAIDTGDLVLVKDVKVASDIKTYMDGYSSGYKSYGDFGDVIVYRRAGSDASTPIIHRALIYLEANPDGRSYSAPALETIPKGKWITGDDGNAWNNISSTLTIFGVGETGITVPINVQDLLQDGHPESGFVTKGDHNSMIDLMFWGPTEGYRPIDISWVVGKARGEIPWFGLLKLWSTNTIKSTSPPNSVTNLWISLLVIVLSPILVDVSLSFLERRKAKTAKGREDGKKDKAEADDSSRKAIEPPES